MIEITEAGRIVLNGMVIGTVTEGEYVQEEGGWKVEPLVTLNLAWMKMAGVHLVVLDDPEVDHHRDGKVLER